MRSLIAATLILAVSVFGQQAPPEPVLKNEEGFDCFLTTFELRDAVDSYLDDPSSTAAKYGAPIGNWCVRNIADFSHMFDSNRNPKSVDFNEDLTGWVTTCARDFSYMFAGATAFNGDVSKFQTGRVVTMAGMFEEAASFNGDVSNWDVFNVVNFERMFGGAASFAGDLSKWDTRCATNISYMFYTALSFNSNIDQWEVSSVKEFEFAFDDAKIFAQNLCPWTEKISNLDPKTAIAMFTGTSCPNATELGPVLNPEEIGEPLTTFCYDCSQFNRKRRAEL